MSFELCFVDLYKTIFDKEVLNPQSVIYSKVRLILSSTEMFKKPLGQTVLTQDPDQCDLGPHCSPQYFHS